MNSLFTSLTPPEVYGAIAFAGPVVPRNVTVNGVATLPPVIMGDIITLTYTSTTAIVTAEDLTVSARGFGSVYTFVAEITGELCGAVPTWEYDFTSAFASFRLPVVRIVGQNLVVQFIESLPGVARAGTYNFTANICGRSFDLTIVVVGSSACGGGGCGGC